jgi:DeoR/GlpR family transcriptional regulator of sugar metabolism
MDLRAGRTTPDLSEAETDRAMIASAHRVVVVADHSKWNVVGLAAIAPISEIDILITDDKLPETARRALEAHVGRLIVVDSA